MRRLAFVGASLLALSLVSTSRAGAEADLDELKSDPDHHKLVFENDQVRVVRWEIGPGQKTAQHRHPDNVNILLADANAKVTTPEGKTAELHTKAGTATWRAGGVHVVENIGRKPMAGILVEPKKPASAMPPGAKDSVAADPANNKVEFENDLIRVVRYRIPAGEKTSMHGHPDNVRVLLTDGSARITTPDGKVVPISGKAGEAVWRTAGQHVMENAGGAAIEGILVEMKGRAGK